MIIRQTSLMQTGSYSTYIKDGYKVKHVVYPLFSTDLFKEVENLRKDLKEAGVIEAAHIEETHIIAYVNKYDNEYDKYIKGNYHSFIETIYNCPFEYNADFIINIGKYKIWRHTFLGQILK